MWQFREVVEGISEACEALGVPVVGGNVSFYNETDGLDIYPTPVVGMVGLVEDLTLPAPRLDRAEPGMDLFLIGTDWAINLAGSAFEKVTFGHVGGRPSAADPTMGKGVVGCARRLAAAGAPVLHDISAGGLAVALAEICIHSEVGAEISYSDWRHLFSEDPHRLLIAAPTNLEVEAIAREEGVPVQRIGSFGGSHLRLGRAELPLQQLIETFNSNFT
jgi:phosphoribosylformylglycinamidine synthase